MSDEPTLPPVNTPRKALAWLWQWSQGHTIAATAIGAFVAGFIVGKL
jgi:hypothetical protein